VTGILARPGGYFIPDSPERDGAQVPSREVREKEIVGMAGGVAQTRARKFLCTVSASARLQGRISGGH